MRRMGGGIQEGVRDMDELVVAREEVRLENMERKEDVSEKC